MDKNRDSVASGHNDIVRLKFGNVPAERVKQTPVANYIVSLNCDAKRSARRRWSMASGLYPDLRAFSNEGQLRAVSEAAHA